MLSLHSDVSHDGQVRAAARPVQEAVNVLGRPFEDCLDPAVGKVAYPPAHTAFKGHPPAGVAEIDALNLTGDQHPIADHKEEGTARPPQTRHPAKAQIAVDAGVHPVGANA